MTSSLGQASLVVQWKRICLPCRRRVETWVWSLGWGDPLEEGNDTLSSLLAWKFPWTEEPGGSSPWGHRGVRHDLATEQQQFFRSHSSERSQESTTRGHSDSCSQPSSQKKKKKERECIRRILESSENWWGNPAVRWRQQQKGEVSEEQRIWLGQVTRGGRGQRAGSQGAPGAPRQCAQRVCPAAPAASPVTC